MEDKKTLPIDYVAYAANRAGEETEIDLERPGWMTDSALADVFTFTLKPKDDASDPDLPIVGVHLASLPDGTPKKLVFFSRVFGQVVTQADAIVSEAQTPYFRLYCIGWEAVVAGRTLKCVSWIYPGGSVVQADEPPYTDEMLAHYAEARRLAAQAA